jgi:hypothetical protein
MGLPWFVAILATLLPSALMTYRRDDPLPRRAVTRTPEPPTARLGPVPITATGILIVIALVGSLAYLLYAITVRDTSQIPLLASGAVVLGLVFGAIAAVGARAAWRSSIRGRDGRAFAHALVGGIASLVAAACFAGAFIMATLSQNPTT